MSEGIPPEWDKLGDKFKVINWLIVLPISKRHKKMSFYEWCRVYDVPLLAEDIVAITGLPAGEV